MRDIAMNELKTLTNKRIKYECYAELILCYALDICMIN